MEKRWTEGSWYCLNEVHGKNINENAQKRRELSKQEKLSIKEKHNCYFSIKYHSNSITLPRIIVSC